MEAWSLLMSGFASALTPYNLLFALIGSIAGTLVGVLPGLGPTAAIAMLLPLASHLDPAPAIIMMAAIYYGAMYGGSTTSILVNIPGEASSVPTAMEGYKLNQQGRGGPALGISAIASFVAGTMGVVGLTFFAPVLSRAALAFGPPEYFALTFLGLSLVVSLSGKDIGKGLLTALFGLLTAVIGLDPLTGVARLTFGSVELMAGIDFVPIIMGLFAISEILSNAEQDTKCILDAKRIEWLPTWQDIKDTWAATIRSGVIGFLAGLIPGCSPAVTSFMVYDLEKRFSKHPEKFGHGAMDAVAAVEGSNNATASGGFRAALRLRHPLGTGARRAARRVSDVRPAAGPAPHAGAARPALDDHRQHVHRQRHAAGAEPAAGGALGAHGPHPLPHPRADDRGLHPHRRLQPAGTRSSTSGSACSSGWSATSCASSSSRSRPWCWRPCSPNSWRPPLRSPS